jgi:hypothetical protein
MWSLRKSSHFLSQVQELRGRVPGLLEAIAGAEFVIAKDPEQGMAVARSRCRCWPVHLDDGITFRVVYSFTPYEVVFQALHRAIAPPVEND